MSSIVMSKQASSTSVANESPTIPSGWAHRPRLIHSQSSSNASAGNGTWLRSSRADDIEQGAADAEQEGPGMELDVDEILNEIYFGEDSWMARGDDGDGGEERAKARSTSAVPVTVTRPVHAVAPIVIPTRITIDALRRTSIDRRSSVGSAFDAIAPPDSPSFEQRLSLLVSSQSTLPHLDFEMENEEVRAIGRRSTVVPAAAVIEDHNSVSSISTLPLPAPLSTPPPPPPSTSVDQSSASLSPNLRLLQLRKPRPATFYGAPLPTHLPTPPPSNNASSPTLSPPPSLLSRTVSREISLHLIVRSPSLSPSPSLGSSFLRKGGPLKKEKELLDKRSSASSTLLSLVGLGKWKTQSNSLLSSPLGSGSDYSTSAAEPAPAVAEYSDLPPPHTIPSMNSSSVPVGNRIERSERPARASGGKAAALLGLGVGTTDNLIQQMNSRGGGTGDPKRKSFGATNENRMADSRIDGGQGISDRIGSEKEDIPSFPCSIADLFSITTEVALLSKYVQYSSKTFLRPKWERTTIILTSNSYTSVSAARPSSSLPFGFVHAFPEHKASRGHSDKEEERLEITCSSSVFVPDDLHGRAFALQVTGRGSSGEGELEKEITWLLGMDEVESFKQWMGVFKKVIADLNMAASTPLESRSSTAGAGEEGIDGLGISSIDSPRRSTSLLPPAPLHQTPSPSTSTSSSLSMSTPRSRLSYSASFDARSDPSNSTSSFVSLSPIDAASAAPATISIPTASVSSSSSSIAVEGMTILTRSNSSTSSYRSNNRNSMSNPNRLTSLSFTSLPPFPASPSSTSSLLMSPDLLSPPTSPAYSTSSEQDRRRLLPRRRAPPADALTSLPLPATPPPLARSTSIGGGEGSLSPFELMQLQLQKEQRKGEAGLSLRRKTSSMMIMDTAPKGALPPLPMSSPVLG